MTQTPTPISAATGVLLVAPLSGSILPIEQVPDPVFAEKMVGDGISIDPVSQVLVAPCDGEIVQMHPSQHAVTLQTAEGIEILMHIGLDTVTLRGKGFTPKVVVGDRVKLGDPLIEFDADYVALHAVSLLTQIVIVNSDQVARFVPKAGQVLAGQDLVLELLLSKAGTTDTSAISSLPVVTSNAIPVPNPVGLHARPAAVLANLAKQYQADVRLKKEDKSVNAKSVTALMGLQVGFKDVVSLVAQGPDAEAAITALSEAIANGLGEEGATPMVSTAEPKPVPQPVTRPRSDDPNTILGVAASPGVAVGYLHQVRQQEIEVAERGGTSDEESRKLEQAIAQAQQEIAALQAKMQAGEDAKQADIFAAHQEILTDPDMQDTTAEAIIRGQSAAYAWKQAYTTQANRLAQLKNDLLAQRANDLRDVGRRVLRILTGATTEAIAYPDQTILAAEDLTPSDMATLDRSKVVGFCTIAGGATSHVAILARSMDIPAIAGGEERLLEVANGTPVVLDGTRGQLRLNPSADEMERTRQRQARIAERRQADLAAKDQPAITTDGHRMEVVANIGSLADAEKSVALGGEGVGLLRTEFVFMERAMAPSEEEQADIYSSIARALGDRPLIIRTLDVGGDKPLPYLPMPHEENPFLGDRGIRLCFSRPDLMRTQFRAILRASSHGNVRIMFPMIARLEELRQAKQVLEEERQALGVAPIEVGIMIEVPSAALMADRLASEVDFFSIGTNDLTQYTLAMDRGHPKLAAQIDALDPAVLRLVDLTVKGATQHGKWVGICGGMGSDPQAVPILVGLGIQELSVSIPTIPSIKAQVRGLGLAECQALAAQALAADTAVTVRQLVPLPEE
ncbi:phosphoenolpyruvate--protein phosphotransferase [Leptolyngbya sp. AN02str]|uniref:phosphoenolpyruvate--protein phosphotransferase n=1 Tax=Leptolyngbya sp. AN02str TaxID=3423363 RepID=UPI003D310A9E